MAAPAPRPSNASRDYQTWLHRHDELRQYNPKPAPAPDPGYQTWLHRHDGLLQFNPPR